jgi:hypothetical protein
MSFGPDLIDENVKLWTDTHITESIKTSFREQYKKDLQKLISLATYFREKDFVIVKSAGNEGLKNLDDEILLELMRNLSDDDFKILNDHFLLVGATDTRDPHYSNSVSKGYYNSLFTTVDISDLKLNNEDLIGTSIAAPRISCFISTAVEDNNIKATEALKAIKEITRQNPSQPITQEGLNQEAKRIAEENKLKVNENNITQRQNSSGGNNSIRRQNEENNTTVQPKGLTNIRNNSDGLVGTKWEHEFKYAGYDSVKKRVLQFYNKSQARIIDYYGDGTIEDKNRYEYNYDPQNTRWVLFQTVNGYGFQPNNMLHYITLENSELYFSNNFGTDIYERLE